MDMTATVDLPTAAEQPLTPVQDAAVPLQMGRNTAYRLIASGASPLRCSRSASGTWCGRVTCAATSASTAPP